MLAAVCALSSSPDNHREALFAEWARARMAETGRPGAGPAAVLGVPGASPFALSDTRGLCTAWPGNFAFQLCLGIGANGKTEPLCTPDTLRWTGPRELVLEHHRDLFGLAAHGTIFADLYGRPTPVPYVFARLSLRNNAARPADVRLACLLHPFTPAGPGRIVSLEHRQERQALDVNGRAALFYRGPVVPLLLCTRGLDNEIGLLAARGRWPEEHSIRDPDGWAGGALVFSVEIQPRDTAYLLLAFPLQPSPWSEASPPALSRDAFADRLQRVRAQWRDRLDAFSLQMPSQRPVAALYASLMQDLLLAGHAGDSPVPGLREPTSLLQLSRRCGALSAAGLGDAADAPLRALLRSQSPDTGAFGRVAPEPELPAAQWPVAFGWPAWALSEEAWLSQSTRLRRVLFPVIFHAAAGLNTQVSAAARPSAEALQWAADLCLRAAELAYFNDAHDDEPALLKRARLLARQAAAARSTLRGAALTDYLASTWPALGPEGLPTSEDLPEPPADDLLPAPAARVLAVAHGFQRAPSANGPAICARLLARLWERRPPSSLGLFAQADSCLPDLTAAAEYPSLLRDILVTEERRLPHKGRGRARSASREGDRNPRPEVILHVLRGFPQEWLKQGSKLKVRGLPTSAGPVGFDLIRESSRLIWEGKAAKDVKVSQWVIYAPPGFECSQATAGGKPLGPQNLHPRWITASGKARRITLELRHTRRTRTIPAE